MDGRIKKWRGLEEYFDELIPLAENSWSGEDLSEIWSNLQDQMLDRPFSDLGKSRSVRFLALGITWEFSWENTYELTSLAEEFLAVLQVLLADLANTDLCLLPTTVDVEIRFGSESDVGIQPIPSNERSKWLLTLTDTEKREDSDAITLELAATPLAYASLLPNEQFFSRLEFAFREGLSNKIFFGQGYRTVFGEFVGREKFESSHRISKVQPEANRPFQPVLHQQLSWYGGPGPGYSKEAAKAVLKNRYERSVIPIQHTLKRLSKNSSFKETVRNLRNDGWLDWHILNAVSMAALNYRANKELGLHASPEEYRQRVIELMDQPENENAEPVPLSEFSEQNLRFHLSATMGSTLMNLGFKIHQMTPDFEAISKFLGERYNYWTDDIDHPDYGF